MDRIDPIRPRTPGTDGVAWVRPEPRLTREERERQRREQERRRREGEAPAPPPDEDDGRPHVDVRA